MGGWRHHQQQQQQLQQQQQQQQEGDRSVVCGPPSAGRALRNRRYRRIFEENHQTKRLFTPEIKRFLKGWLVRRRKNPYPNRTEKKELAFKTGLTYIQICNWFANWRRKLKNSSQNTEESWGHLIKDYNNKAKGNVEQFSISSDDSIWDETAFAIDSEQNSTIVHDCHLTDTDHCYYSSTTNNNNNNDNGTSKQYFDSGAFKENGGCSSWSGGDEGTRSSSGEEEESGGSATTAGSAAPAAAAPDAPEKPPVLLSKWLESAARYTAGTSYVPWAAYNVTWRSPQEGAGALAGAAPRKQGKWREGPGAREEAAGGRGSGRRQREELDAAEALTYLSVWHPAAPEPAPTRPITGH